MGIDYFRRPTRLVVSKEVEVVEDIYSLYMMDVELLKRAKNLQREAEHVLARLGLFERIRKIAEPELVGSAKNGLMVMPDIDIHAWMENVALARVATLLSEFASMPTIQKVQFNNYRELRRDDRKDRINFPHAYYVGIRSIESSGEWNIDMWFGARGQIGDYDDSELRDTSDEQRLVILRLKESWREGKGYRDGVLSTNFYMAVMRSGVRSIADFEAYLKTKR